MLLLISINFLFELKHNTYVLKYFSTTYAEGASMLRFYGKATVSYSLLKYQIIILQHTFADSTS